MRPNSPTAETPGPVGRTARLHLLILAAAVWHIAVTLAIFLIGRSGRAPGQFNQNGLGSFALDGFMYQGEVLELCGVLKNQGIIAWTTWPTQLHVRLYSLPVAVLGQRTSFNILTIEPLNLIYYLAILILVFKLGELVFNYRAGLTAAATVAVWPSFLLHTTQLLRDPLLITAVLILMLSLTLCLKSDLAWPRAILPGMAAAAAIVIIRIVRLPMWNILWPIVFLAMLFLIVRFIGQRRCAPGNLVCAIMIVAAMTITPSFQSSFHNQQIVNRPRLIVPEEVQMLPVEKQIEARRYAFSLQNDPVGEPVPSVAGSDIDRDVQFNSTTDIIRHVPRAVAVGFLAPFPNMWLASGKQVGAAGRRLAGFETLFSYVIECLALFGLWRERKNPAAWFIFLVVALGAVALGLVVANIGALYRLRFPFWALLIVCGANGAVYLFHRRVIAAGASNGLAREETPGTVQN